MALATVTGTGKPKAKQLAAKVSAREAQPRSVFDNLVLTNKAMLRQIKEAVVGVARNPLGSLGNMLKGFAFPFLHPIQAFKGWKSDIEDDTLDGAFSVAGTVTAMAWMGAVIVAAACVVAAPVTGGASLAVAATAFAVGDAFFLGCIAADAGGILLHEYRGATAKSSGEAIAEGEALASYVEDEALNIVAWKGVSAAEAKLARSIQAQSLRLGGRAVAEGFSLAGIYELPSGANAVRGAKLRAPRVIAGGGLAAPGKSTSP